MALLLVRIKVLLIYFILYEEVRGCTSFVDKFCKLHGKILNCDDSFHQEESIQISEGPVAEPLFGSKEMPLLNFGSTCEVNKIVINNFLVLEVGDTSCADMNIKNSNITFMDTPLKQCPSKRIEIRSSFIDRVPAEVSKIVAYSSTINVLHDIQLKFGDIHDSEIKSVSKLSFSSSDVSFFDSKVSFSDTFVIEESSSVNFINSDVTFNDGSHVSVNGALTLQGTTLDAKFIQLTPSSKIYILSPKVHWLIDESKQSGSNSNENADRRESSESPDTKSESNHDSGEQTLEGQAVLFLVFLIIFLVYSIILTILVTFMTLRIKSMKIQSIQECRSSELEPLGNKIFPRNSVISQLHT